VEDGGKGGRGSGGGRDTMGQKRGWGRPKCRDYMSGGLAGNGRWSGGLLSKGRNVLSGYYKVNTNK